MSTNKTPNYNLHSWLPQDEFHVSEINENFAKLDSVLGGKGAVVLGSYQDNGASTQRRIELGAPIKCLLLENTKGQRQDYGSSYTVGAFLMPGFPLLDGSAKLDGGALVVQTVGYSRINDPSNTYLYLAILDKSE